MGICCGKDVMPVVDAADPTMSPQAGLDQPMTAVAFDYVFDGQPVNEPRRRSNSPQNDGSGGGERTPRELDATTLASTGTARTLGALSYITNGNTDVSYDLVGQFVERIRDGQISPLEGSLVGSAAPTTGGGSSSSTPWLTRDQRASIDALPTLRDKVGRVMELEELHRADIVAAYRMNMMIFNMASQRIVPTVRRRRSTLNSEMLSTSKKAKSSKKLPPLRGDSKSKSMRYAPAAVPPAVVIHAKDINIEFKDDEELVGADTTLRGLDLTVVSLAETYEAAAEVPLADENYSPSSGRATSFAANAMPSLQQQEKRPSPPAVVEHYEMMALSAREVSITGNVKGLVVTESWDFLSLPDTAAQLSKGDAMYRFMSKPANQLDPASLEMLDMFVNVSSFSNELIENGAPMVDCKSKDSLSNYVVILAKAMYVLPGVRLATLTKELLASLDYQRNCQAGDTKFHEDVTTPFTFRQTKTIVKFLFSLVIQMKVSEITDPALLNRFKDFDGIVPAKAILLERTKRNVRKVDSTAKCKSVLLYYPINDGVLVSHATIVLNTSMPTVISKILHTFGGQGAKENADAAQNTRRYMIHRFGDSREGLSYITN